MFADAVGISNKLTAGLRECRLWGRHFMGLNFRFWPLATVAPAMPDLDQPVVSVRYREENRSIKRHFWPGGVMGPNCSSNQSCVSRTSSSYEPNTEWDPGYVLCFFLLAGLPNRLKSGTCAVS
jgi:hypothetical protein